MSELQKAGVDQTVCSLSLTIVGGKNANEKDLGSNGDLQES